MLKVFERVLGILCVLMLLGGMNTVLAEQAAAGDEYIARAQLSLGNNLRLKRVLDQAKAGEQITVGIIGGSITEGAGATGYAECYAMRVGQGIAQRYGVGIGSNVTLINAGVGGTPSTFGWLRYERDIVSRVPAADADGLPDIVIIEFAVNDWNEPTAHQCYESMVKSVLQQPNEPAVILLFSVFRNGWNLQDELKKIGTAYDLMMVSIRDGVYPEIGKRWTEKEWFFDEYHPTSLGHKVMADCVLGAIDAAYEAKTSEADVTLDVPPAYGLGYMNLRRIFASDTDLDSIALNRGSFAGDDREAYTNRPVGRVCGRNFMHRASDGNEPLAFTAVFSKLLVGWRTAVGYGNAEVYIDGKLVRTLSVPSGSWGQTEVSLLLNDSQTAEHRVEIKMAEDSVRRLFTITCMGIAE